MAISVVEGFVFKYWGLEIDRNDEVRRAGQVAIRMRNQHVSILPGFCRKRTSRISGTVPKSQPHNREHFESHSQYGQNSTHKKEGWQVHLEFLFIICLTNVLPATSIHSRAAKRASSPGIDLDKSLKDLKPPVEAKKQRQSVLAVHQGAGVTKKSKNGRKSVLSAKAKRRQEKGLDRAEAVMDKKEKKVEKSKGRARTVQERAKAWEELNKKMLAKKARDEALALEKENLVNEVEDDEMEEDERDEEVNMDAEANEDPVAEPMAIEEIAQSIPLPAPVDDEDEIL